jgi:hypothetical protein
MVLISAQSASRVLRRETKRFVVKQRGAGTSD